MKKIAKEVREYMNSDPTEDLSVLVQAQLPGMSLKSPAESVKADREAMDRLQALLEKLGVTTFKRLDIAQCFCISASIGLLLELEASAEVRQILVNGRVTAA